MHKLVLAGGGKCLTGALQSWPWGAAQGGQAGSRCWGGFDLWPTYPGFEIGIPLLSARIKSRRLLYNPFKSWVWIKCSISVPLTHGCPNGMGMSEHGQRWGALKWKHQESFWAANLGNHSSTSAVICIFVVIKLCGWRALDSCVSWGNRIFGLQLWGKAVDGSDATSKELMLCEFLLFEHLTCKLRAHRSSAEVSQGFFKGLISSENLMWCMEQRRAQEQVFLAASASWPRKAATSWANSLPVGEEAAESLNRLMWASRWV